MFNTPTRATPRRGLRARDSVSRASLFSGSVAGDREPARSSRLGSVRERETASPASVAESAATTVQTSHTVRAARQPTTQEEWDTRSTWSRDERHSVNAAGALPFEVNELLAGADFIVNSVSGHVDPVSGFALVASPSRCVAWNYAKRTHGSPTVYSFEAPYPSRRTGANTSLAAVPPALSSFVGSGSEPGLILVSATGEIRFWDSVTHGLSEPAYQRYTAHQLALGEDFAERLWKLDDTTFVLTTTASTAWGISISNIGGRLVPTAAPFTRNSGIFSRNNIAIFNNTAERGGIVAVAPAPGGVYLLGRSTLQKWIIGPDGGARLVQEFDLRESIGSGLFDDARTWQSGNVHLELNDLVAIGPDQLAAFVSYTIHDGSSDARRAHNSHKIVCFENNAQNNMVTIANIVHLSYVAHADPRMLDVPRLYIPTGSQTAFVRFADAIVMTSLVASQPYEDTITLNDSATNAFIGIGSTAGPQRKANTASLVAMAATGGIMNIDVHQGVVKAKQLSSVAAATARIKSKIEQAVFFGDRSENPLTFDLPAGFKGDLAEAAEAVSTEIVSSTSPYQPHISEIRPQLQDRLARLQELMVYIHHNGGLSLLPEGSRRRLCSHAEKVKSATELWDYQNRLMDQLDSQSPRSLLADSIQTLMQTLGSTGEEDVVRSFFRKQVLHIDRLLETVYATFQSAVNAAGPAADLSAWVLEANRIFITALRAAALLREHESSIYQVDRLHPMTELWTASDGIIGNLDSLYGATQRLIKDRTRSYGSAVDEAPPAHPTPAALASGSVAAQKDQAVLKHQMAQLAAALCENMEDKLRTSATQMNTGTDPSDGLTLAQRWDQMKPRIIRPLVDIDRVTEAYELAQHHRDFPTLVYLCHNPASSQGPARIEAYIETFGKEFAFVLYQWYIDQGQLHALLTQDEVYGSLLTAFFEAHPHPELSWMHDIACKRYGGAAAALVAVDGSVDDLAEKHLISSIGKLAAVAEMKTYGPTPPRTAQLNSIDDELDLITTEGSLADAIRAMAPTSGFPRVPSAEGFVAEHAGPVASRPAFKAELISQVRELLAGTALDIESLVDVLTLTDATPERASDAAVAIQRLAVSPLPQGRKQVALLSIWRRVYIYDDWRDIAKTAGRSEQAQRSLVERSLAYHTLRALKDTDVPPNFILPPSAATDAPLPAELAARYPAYAPEEIEALLADHRDEIAALEALLDDEAVGFEERIKGVMRIVDAGDEIELDGEGDVDM